jgi:hypothetical protein
MQRLRFFWDAAVALDPAAEVHDEGRLPLCHPEQLRRLFDAAGIRDLALDAMTIPTVFPSFDAYWGPFAGGQGPAGFYVQTLSASARDALEDRLRQMLPRDPDGSVPLKARAWAVRGRSR